MANQPKPKGLFFGLTTVDIINGLPCHPAPNRKSRAAWQEVYAGGPAANAAVAYAALGNRSFLCSSVGRHPVGQLAGADLAEHNVVLLDYSGDPQQQPVISSIMIDTSSGDRCVVYSDSSTLAPLRDLDEAAVLEDVSVLLFDGFFPARALDLARKAREMDITTVLDGGSWKEGTANLLPSIDYAICSADFTPPGCSSPREVLTYLTDQGIDHCAVSRGELPLIVSDSGRLSSIAVPRITAIDTLGAGDVLHGAFCHFIGSESFGASLSHAAAIASASCGYRGTRRWIRHLAPALS